MGQARRFQPMQVQRRESKADHGAHGARHIALPGMGRAHPIAQSGGLRDTATDMAQRDAAKQHRIGIAKYQERESLVIVDFQRMPPHPPPERAAGQVLGGPDRLPGSQMGAAALAQTRPGLEIAHVGGAQHNAVAAHHRRLAEA